MSNIEQNPDENAHLDHSAEFAATASVVEPSIGHISVQETINRVSKEWGANYPELGEELRGN